MRTYSTYEGSDTQSITSSEEDQWGTQIGGYNEANPAYPPPPVALLVPDEDRLIGASTLAENELEAMLEAGFEDDRSPTTPSATGSGSVYAPRFQHNESSSANHLVAGNGYAPLTRATTPPQHPGGYGMLPPQHAGSPHLPPGGFGSTGVAPEWKTHAKKRSGGASRGEKYGPLGPLDPGSGHF
jgi:chitin synthase